MDVGIRLFFGYLFFYGAPFGIIILILNKIKKIIIASKKNYQRVEGKVIEYIKDTDEKYVQRQKNELRKKHPKIYNKVINFIENYGLNNDNKRDSYYYAVIEYEVGGKKYQIFDTVGTDIKGKIGIKKKIKYNQTNPSEAFLVTEFSNIILIFVLLITMMVGYCLIYF